MINLTIKSAALKTMFTCKNNNSSNRIANKRIQNIQHQNNENQNCDHIGYFSLFPTALSRDTDPH